MCYWTEVMEGINGQMRRTKLKIDFEHINVLIISIVSYYCFDIKLILSNALCEFFVGI